MAEPKKERNLKQIDGKWYLDFTFNKKRIRHFGGYTKEQAKNTLIKMKADKLDEKRGFKKPAKPNIDFMEFAREFIEIYSKQNKRSWGRDESSLKALEPYFKGKAIAEITPELVERYKAKRKVEVAAGTCNRELVFLKTLFNKAVEWGRLESSPVAKVKKFREPIYKVKILDAAEIKKLLDVSNSHLKPILIVALNCAMRRGEILALKWENVDLSKRRIHIEDSKSGRSRDIPMNNAVVEALSVISQHNKYVFHNPVTGRPLKSIKSSFRTARRNAKIKGLRFHDLRHTSATRLVEAGVDLVTVSKILGHSTIAMTVKYAHPSAENMRLAVEKLDEFYEQTRQKVDTAEIKKPASVSLQDN